MNIQKTTDYKLFKYIGNNRIINDHHLQRLTASVAKHNMLSYFPILVNEKFEIIDGQHRFLVAKFSKLELYYIQGEGLTVEDARLLNANVRPWKLDDYMSSYAAQGNKEYQILKAFVNENNLPITTALAILTKTQNRQKALGLRGEFKAGLFKVTELEYAQDLMDKLDDIKPKLKGVIWRQREFIFAFMKAEEVADHNRLIEQSHNTSWMVEPQVSSRDYIRILEDIYNFNIKTARVRFF